MIPSKQLMKLDLLVRRCCVCGKVGSLHLDLNVALGVAAETAFDAADASAACWFGDFDGCSDKAHQFRVLFLGEAHHNSICSAIAR